MIVPGFAYSLSLVELNYQYIGTLTNGITTLVTYGYNGFGIGVGIAGEANVTIGKYLFAGLGADSHVQIFGWKGYDMFRLQAGVRIPISDYL